MKVSRWRALTFGAGALVLSAWWLRPPDPEAWREFTRKATDAELQDRLPSDNGDRAQIARWKRYLQALSAGDDEAFRVAARLCPRLGAHTGEEFLSALSWNLERAPARVFELERRCFPRGLACAPWFEGDEDPLQVKSALERRRKAVAGLLDGGWSDEASACLVELRD